MFVGCFRRPTLAGFDYGARFYDPTIDRWVVIDPECESGEQPSVNPYHYVYNNPISHTDPDGREPAGCCDEFMARATGIAVATVDNVFGTNLREAVGQASYGSGSLRTAFNDATMQADKAAVVVGSALIGQSIMTAEAGGVLTASIAGAEVGIPMVVVAGVEATLGAALASHGAQNLQNSQVKAQSPQNPDPPKKSNVSSGNKNSPHANQKAKEAAQQRYQDSRKEYDNLKSKANKTPGDKKDLDKLRKEVDRNKQKADNTGENHSQKAKGNKNKRN